MQATPSALEFSEMLGDVLVDLDGSHRRPPPCHCVASPWHAESVPPIHIEFLLASQPEIPLWGRTHWPDSNSLSSDDAKSPAEVGLRLKQCHGGVCYFVSRFGSEPEQDDTTSRWKPSVENKLAEILVEGKQDSLALRTNSGNILIRDARAFFSHREYLPACISKCRQGRPREILIGNKRHAVLSG